MPCSEPIRLGLIGDNIAMSQSPRLHRLAGELSAQPVTYDRLVPRERGKTFDELFEYCARSGYRGVNITYPYKEKVVSKVEIEDELVRAIGAVNTVVFKNGRALGFNTDYSGFGTAYSGTCGGASPGPTCLVGAGGVGRAIAFGLVALGARDIRITDQDPAKAEALAAALHAGCPGLRTQVGSDAPILARGVEGLVNGTPVGMVGHAGTPLPRAAMTGARWAFDAVYTPVDTAFLQDAASEGLTVITGYELFIGQGVDAWKIFTSIAVDRHGLRAGLEQPTNREGAILLGIGHPP
jgi:shikimate dehydrogenase